VRFELRVSRQPHHRRRDCYRDKESREEPQCPAYVEGLEVEAAGCGVFAEQGRRDQKPRQYEEDHHPDRAGIVRADREPVDLEGSEGVVPNDQENGDASQPVEPPDATSDHRFPLPSWGKSSSHALLLMTRSRRARGLDG